MNTKGYIPPMLIEYWGNNPTKGDKMEKDISIKVFVKIGRKEEVKDFCSYDEFLDYVLADNDSEWIDEFNIWLNRNNEKMVIFEKEFRLSEILYDCDIERYEMELLSWIEMVTEKAWDQLMDYEFARIGKRIEIVKLKEE